LDSQYILCFVSIYVVLTILAFIYSKKTILFLFILGLLILNTISMLCYWVFGQHYAIYWLSIIAIDFLILLGALNMEKSATTVNGASGWVCFGWLMVHIQVNIRNNVKI